MFDAYSRRARVLPAILVCVPALVVLLASLASVEAVTKAAGLAATIASAVVSGIVRKRGRRLQAGLWSSWGGPPAVSLLRWSGNDAEDTRERHEQLAKIAGKSMPSVEEERDDPATADKRYDDAVKLLIELTRKRDEFPLVAEENAEYGFRRNTLGLRPFGLAVAAIVAVAMIVVFFLVSGSTGRRLVAYGIPFAASLACLVLWWRVVTPAWVRHAAERYAERLIASIMVLSRKT